MAIDLNKIEPNKVSTDVNSYSTFIYGVSKIGKSTLVHDLYGDKVLHVMTEKRYKALEGAYVQYVSSWSEYLQVMKQLKNPDIKKKFDVVSVDTVENLYDFLEKYVAAKYKEQHVGERNDLWGSDWGDLKTMWKDGLLKIEQAGYTPVFVSHAIQTTVQIPKSGVLESDTKNLTEFNEVVSKEDGQTYLEFTKYVPDLKDKVMAPINKMVDNILFLTQTADTTGQEHRVIHTRESLQWLAGSTFKNIKSPIPLSAESYKMAVSDAVNNVPDEYKKSNKVSDQDIKNEKPNYDELMKHAKVIAFSMNKVGKMDRVKAVVDHVFGVGNSLTEATVEQVEQLSVAVEELEDEAKKAGVEV